MQSAVRLDRALAQRDRTQRHRGLLSHRLPRKWHAAQGLQPQSDRRPAAHADDPNRADVVAGLRADGTIQSGGDGIKSVTYNAPLKRYEIIFTDFSFSIDDDVAQVTARSSVLIAGYTSLQGELHVSVRDTDGNTQPASFSVVVWDLE